MERLLDDMGFIPNLNFNAEKLAFHSFWNPNYVRIKGVTGRARSGLCPTWTRPESVGWVKMEQQVPTRNASRISRFESRRASSCTSQFWISSPVPSCGSTKCNVFNIPWLAWCSICCIYAVLNPPPTIAPQNPTSLFSWEYVVLVTLQGHTWHKCSHLPTCPFKCMCTSLMFWIPNMTLNSTGSCLLPMSNDEMGFSWSSFHLEGGGGENFPLLFPLYKRGKELIFCPQHILLNHKSLFEKQCWLSSL